MPRRSFPTPDPRPLTPRRRNVGGWPSRFLVVTHPETHRPLSTNRHSCAGARWLSRRAVAAALVSAVLGSPGRSPGQQPSGGTVQPQGATGVTPAEKARAELEHPRFTAAGVHFMSGMIAHHAQAIVMAGWASSHGASPAVQALAERIAVSQTDEIKLMQDWLRDRHQPMPPSDPRRYAMPGMEQPMLMPGMLTPAQMARLDSARGATFDHVFLTDMITHHAGAIDMVHQLNAAGEEQDDALSMYATNVEADQSAEIARMQRMLAALPLDTPTPHSPH
jgi:uncharacterized protein (DUF305 family)